MKWLRWGGLLSTLLGITVFMTQANVIGGTEEQLREVIDYMYGDDVTIAALPSDFPLSFELPIPENTHIVASTIYPHQNQVTDNQSQTLNILMRSENIPPSAIAEQYQSYFLANGWQELNFQFDETTGFYSSNSVGGSYCYERDYYLYYNVWTIATTENEPIDWSITIITNPSEAECQVVNNNYVQLSDFFPQFEAIEGTELLEYVGVNAMHIREVSTTYVTGLRLSIPMEDVFEAYNEQLTDAAWQQQSLQISDTFAISDWIIETEQLGLLDGRLVILQKSADSSEYTAYLSIEIR